MRHGADFCKNAFPYKCFIQKLWLTAITIRLSRGFPSMSKVDKVFQKTNGALSANWNMSKCNAVSFSISVAGQVRV